MVTTNIEKFFKSVSFTLCSVKASRQGKFLTVAAGRLYYEGPKRQDNIRRKIKKAQEQSLTVFSAEPQEHKDGENGLLG